MKKILSILCTLALVLGAVLIPGMLSASAESTAVSIVTYGGSTQAYTDGEVSAHGIPSSVDNTWGSEHTMATNFKLEADTDYVLYYGWKGHNYNVPVKLTAVDDPTKADFKTSGMKLDAANGNKSNQGYKNSGILFNSSKVMKDGYEYLGIMLSDFGTDSYLLSDIKIEKVTLSSDYIYPAEYNDNAYATMKGTDVAFGINEWVSSGSFVFDYQLAADKEYKLSFEFLGRNRTGDVGAAKDLWSVSAFSSFTVANSAGTKLAIEPLKGADHNWEWKKYEFTFKGSDVGADGTNKYLALVQGFFYSVNYFKNIKIEEVTTGGSSSEVSSGSTSSESTSSGATSSGATSSDTTSSGTSSGGTSSNPARDTEFIYPTKLSGAATESADDKKVQKWDKLDVGDLNYAGGTFRPTYGWASGANTGVLVFDETLEANAEYVLEFDRFSKASASDIVKIGTADAIGNADFTNSVVVESGDCKTWGVYWHEGVSFKTGDVTNGTNNRLAISIQSGEEGCLLKNFRFAKVTRDTNYIYPSSIGAAMGVIAENGAIAYSQTYVYDTAWLAFDYQLKADATYIVEFDYYGHNVTATGGYNWRFGAASTADLAASTNADTFATGDKFVNVAPPSNGGWLEWNGLNSKTYNHVARIVKGSDIVTDTNKNLVIFSKSYDSVPFLKNFKITEFSVKEPYLSPSNISGSIEITPENNGDVGFGMYNSTLSERSGVLTFDYQIDPDKTYVLKFQGIAHGEWRVPFGIGVTSGKDKSDIATAKPFSSENWGNDVTKIPFPKSMKNWTPAGFMFKGSDLIVGEKKNLALKLNIYYSGEAGNTATYQPTMVKNITIEEFKGDGYMHPVKYGNKTFVSLDGADIAYMNNYYDVCYMAYNFEVKPDKEYLITFDIKGCNTGLGAGEFGWSATAVADPYTVNFTDSVRPTTYAKLNVPNAKDGKFVSHAITLKGSDMGADATNKYFVMVKDGIEQHTYIKNFKILEKPPVDSGSVLLNGNFDDPNIATEFWNDTNGVKSHSDEESHIGSYSMHIESGNFVPVSQKADLLPDTNYELSFYYKGNVGGQSIVALSRDILEISTRYGFAYGVAPLGITNEWNKFTLTFNTGSYSNIYIAFMAGPTSDYYVDSVKLCTTSAAAKWNANTLLTEPSILTNANYSPIDHTEFDELTTYRNWKAADGKDLMLDSTFDNKGASEWGEFISASNGVLSIAAGEGLNGSNALKFSAVKQAEKTTAYFYVNVEPNTSYFLTYKSRVPYWSQENIADARIGIANVFQGSQFYVYREETRGYRLPCNDNEWHRTAVPFYSGSNNRVAFSLTGANTTAYFDDIQIFKVADRVDDRSEISKVTDLNSDLHPYVTNTAPTKIYVGATKNLVRNSTFEIADSKFWQKSLGYKNTDDKYVTALDWNGIAEIKETGTSRGKALYYESNDHITGYPLGTSFIKYFDVAPNTEYTFVYDYLVYKNYNNPGVGSVGATYTSADFGIAGASSLDMSVISSIKVADAYNPNLVWQRAAISFNTNGYKQVAFFIRDNGGAVYFDNISLFKSSDGSTTPIYEPEPPEEDEDDTSSTSSGSTSSDSTSSGSTSSDSTSSGSTSSDSTSSGSTSSDSTSSGSGGGTPVLPPVFVQGEIKSDEFVVTGETGNKTVSGIVPGTTVQEVLDTLENKQNIKAFDAEGNEVTDTSVPVGNGFSFRYMDGFSAVDAAVALVRGDVNNDGYIDVNDMRRLMRSMVYVLTEPITDEEKVVADIDGDGVITSHDIALISMHIGDVKALEPIVVGQ